jgi:hypothetical protein
MRTQSECLWAGKIVQNLDLHFAEWAAWIIARFVEFSHSLVRYIFYIWCRRQRARQFWEKSVLRDQYLRGLPLGKPWSYVEYSHSRESNTLPSFALQTTYLCMTTFIALSFFLGKTTTRWKVLYLWQIMFL